MALEAVRYLYTSSTKLRATVAVCVARWAVLPAALRARERGV